MGNARKDYLWKVGLATCSHHSVTFSIVPGTPFFDVICMRNFRDSSYASKNIDHGVAGMNKCSGSSGLVIIPLLSPGRYDTNMPMIVSETSP